MILSNDASHSEQTLMKSTAIKRFCFGLLQGIALYFLYTAGKNETVFATSNSLFAPLILVALFLPTLIIVSLAHLPRKRLFYWATLVLFTLFGLAYYEQWRNSGALSFNGWGEVGDDKAKYPSVLLVFFTATICFISHALINAANTDGKQIASYSTYFDSAWKLWVQLKFSYLFLGAFWLILYLGANLFLLIKLDFLHKALQEAWFVIPVCMTALSFALHLTDVRPAIVNSIRNLLLVLLSWILPIAVIIIAGFLLTLPFTGLSNLWATKRASTILLCAIAALIVLINTAFQNGDVHKQVPAILRHGAKLACFLLLPLSLIAAYAISLRVSEYGWTTDRIIATCCVFVAICYALGYFWAALRSPEWLSKIATINIACAFLVLAIILSLFSPVLDPARLSVSHQMNRLSTGAVSISNFDFAYLKFQGKRFGADALKRLDLDKNHPEASEISKKIALVMAQKNSHDKNPQLAPTPIELEANLKVYPTGTVLPDSFKKQEWKGKTNNWELPDCFFKRSETCDVIRIDFDGDGVDELLVIANNSRSTRPSVFKQQNDQSWTHLGLLADNPKLCEKELNLLKMGQFKLSAPINKDIEINGQRYMIRAPYSTNKPCQ
jgi:Domain of unknown function (DUF4153)